MATPALLVVTICTDSITLPKIQVATWPVSVKLHPPGSQEDAIRGLPADLIARVGAIRDRHAGGGREMRPVGESRADWVKPK